MPEIPEEAIEAATRAIEKADEDTLDYERRLPDDGYDAHARASVTAAFPFIRAAVLEEAASRVAVEREKWEARRTDKLYDSDAAFQRAIALDDAVAVLKVSR